MVKVFILSRLKIESPLIKQAQEGVDPVEKNAAENLKNLLLVDNINFIHYLYFISGDHITHPFNNRG